MKNPQKFYCFKKKRLKRGEASLKRECKHGGLQILDRARMRKRKRLSKLPLGKYRKANALIKKERLKRGESLIKKRVSSLLPEREGFGNAKSLNK